MNIVGGTDDMVSKINQIAEATQKQAEATEMVSIESDRYPISCRPTQPAQRSRPPHLEELYGESQLLKRQNQPL